MEIMKRALAIMMTVALMITSVPAAFVTEAHAAENTDTRVADASTLDGWKEFFGESEDNFSTRYSGYVWTDKTVMKDASAFSGVTEQSYAGNTSIDRIEMDESDSNNFLVALSAMASSKAIKGEENKPIDTMIVLDLSSSMYNGGNKETAAVSTMVDSVNDFIKEIQELNVNNRTGVTIYYGGPDLLQAKKDCYQLWLPLDRYTHSSNDFLKITTSSGKLVSVGVNDGVTNSSGTTVSAMRTVPNVSGTYMQLGILSALAQFMAADAYVPKTAEVNPGMPRTPVMVFMTDGEPTAATNIYTDINQDAIMGSNWVGKLENGEWVDGRSANETDFLTQLTSAYAKAMMDAHYVEETPLFYTLGAKANEDSSISYDVIDPSCELGKEAPSETIAGYWDTIVKDGSIELTYKKCKGQWSHTLIEETTTVTSAFVDGKKFPSDVSQREYVDRAFLSENVNQMAEAFRNIFNEIYYKTHAYPTLVEKNENLDGYVSFVDKIGKYMHVTDVKGIIMDEKLYSGEEFAKKFADKTAFGADIGKELANSINDRFGISEAETIMGLACDNGQIKYGNGTYSNYIGWYADEQGQYLGFWHEGVTDAPEGAVYKNRSYFYLGESGAKSDMMYTSVRHSTNIATGEETLAFGVPAALIPTVKYNVLLDEQRRLKDVSIGGEDSPIRLVYEVALDDAINEFTVYDPEVVDPDYAEANSDDEGNVYFYTNQYEADLNVGYGKVNAYSYFRPSRQNESYYYIKNETIYADQNGTVYTGSKPDANGTYYRAVDVYSRNGDANSKETVYVKIEGEVIASAEKRDENTWYIPSGDVFLNINHYLKPKTDAQGNSTNYTDTLPNVNNPFVDINDPQANLPTHRFVMGDTLGNNGRVHIVPETGLKITKSVEEGGETNDVFEFTVASENEIDGEYRAVKFGKDGTETEGKVRFENGSAKVELKDGESLIICELSAGNIYTVTEKESAEYVLTGITVKGNTAADATVTLEEDRIIPVGFTNAPRKTGNLTVAKLLEYPAGVNADIENAEFSINVKLEGIAVSENMSFDTKHSGNGDITNVTLGTDKSFDVTLKNGESIEITGIPEGTLATVTENLGSESVFVTDKFIVNGNDSQSGVLEIQQAPTIDSVTVVNKYEPAPAKIKIDLSGEKTLLDAEGNPAEWKDDFEFTFHLDQYNGEKWCNIETITVGKDDNGNIDFEPIELGFDTIGNYGYRVFEVDGGFTLSGIVYDPTVYAFTVAVTDEDLDNKLEAAVYPGINGAVSAFASAEGEWTNDDINFTNINKRGSTSASVTIEKQLDNPSESPLVSLEGFTFELYEMADSGFASEIGKVAASGATDAAGETSVTVEYEYDEKYKGKVVSHYYQLRETVPADSDKIPGMNYSEWFYNFEVKVTANDEGEMTSTMISHGTGDGNNRNLMLKDSSAPDGSNAGTAQKYGFATFANEYNPAKAEVSLDVSKELTGKNLTEKFSFTIEETDGEYSETKENEAPNAENPGKAKVNFSALEFTKVGTYQYTIKENIPDPVPEGFTYDRTVYTVVVTVTDGGKGSLAADMEVLTVAGEEIVFRNSYIPEPIEVSIEGTKTLTGKDLTAGHFNFILTECDENWMPLSNGKNAITPNTAEGKFAFEKLVYDEVGTHYFTVAENIPEETKGVTYDETEYKIVIDITYDADSGNFAAAKTVTANGNETEEIAFRNEYHAEPVSTTIYGNKKIDGREMGAEGNPTFTFELYESDEDWNVSGDPAATADSDESGSFSFELGEYSRVGTYYYVVKENIPDPVPDGYTYDIREYGVVVEVTDNLEGNLVASVAYKAINEVADDAGNMTKEETDTANIIFTNVYEITGTAEVTVEGVKYAKGFVLTDKAFTFLLTNEKGEGIKAVRNDANGKFSFGFEYVPSDVGSTYTYHIIEKNDNQEHILYDSTVYKVVIEVLDDNKGGIATNVTINGEALDPEKEQVKFENHFHYDPPTDPEKPEEEENAITGGDMNVSLLAALAAISMTGIAASFAAGKKKK